MPLAMMMGHSDFSMPNTNHPATPKVNSEYMIKEMADVFLVLNIFRAWGIKANVVQAAARYPMMSIQFTFVYPGEMDSQHEA